MAQSTCSKCTSTLFEIRPIFPRGATKEMLAVQCVMCGTVAEIVEQEDVAARLAEHTALLTRIANAVAPLDRP